MADPTVSLCMIVKNEEAYLADCLASAQPFVNEMIVVDTGSTDRTVKIAKQFGAKVFHFQWCDDFAAARNESLRHAQGDWILVLDADERLDAESGRVTLKLISDPEVIAYYIKLICPTHHDGGMVRLGWFPRLFRNGIGACFKGIIHEQVAPSLVGKGKIAHGNVEIYHTGYLKSPEEMAAKAVRNISLLERQVRDDPQHAIGWYHLAEAYNYAGRLAEAESCYRKSLALSVIEDHTYSDGVAAVAIQNLGGVLIREGKLDEGIRELERAREFFPQLASVYVHLGHAYIQKEKFQQAIELLTRAIDLASRTPEGEMPEVQMSPWLAWFLLGAAQGRLGQRPEALSSFQQAYRLKPDLQDAYWLRGLTALEEGFPGIAIEDLEAAQRLGKDSADLWAALGTARGNLGDLSGAVEAFREALRRDPNSSATRLNLCRALQRLERWDELIAEGQTLLESGSESPELYRLLAESCSALRAWQESAVMYEGLLSLVDSPDPEDLFKLATCWYEADESDKALETITKAIELSPCTKYWALQGHCYLKLGDTMAALASYRRSAEGLPELSSRTKT
jgi:tetratricopeptide (TPR) repeat protein